MFLSGHYGAQQSGNLDDDVRDAQRRSCSLFRGGCASPKQRARNEWIRRLYALQRRRVSKPTAMQCCGVAELVSKLMELLMGLSRPFAGYQYTDNEPSSTYYDYLYGDYLFGDVKDMCTLEQDGSIGFEGLSLALT